MHAQLSGPGDAQPPFLAGRAGVRCLQGIQDVLVALVGLAQGSLKNLADTPAQQFVVLKRDQYNVR